jgi:hypothetical protein
VSLRNAKGLPLSRATRRTAHKSSPSLTVSKSMTIYWLMSADLAECEWLPLSWINSVLSRATARHSDNCRASLGNCCSSTITSIRGVHRSRCVTLVGHQQKRQYLSELFSLVGFSSRKLPWWSSTVTCKSSARHSQATILRHLELQVSSKGRPSLLSKFVTRHQAALGVAS